MVSAELQCDVSRNDGIVTIALAGDVDISSRAAMCGALDEALSARPSLVVVDFSRLSFLDSTGVNCLVQARADGEAVGCRFVVRNATGIARRVLEITGLSDLMGEESDRVDDRDPDAEVGT
jgi:anti-sigma B factor antagonist